MFNFLNLLAHHPVCFWCNCPVPDCLCALGRAINNASNENRPSEAGKKAKAPSLGQPRYRHQLATR